MKTYNPLLVVIVVFCLVLAIEGCYSFRGGSVPLHLKTIAIPLFDDQSGSAEPTVRERITIKLIERFRQDNSLTIAERTVAHAVLEGILTGIPDEPYLVSPGETVSKRKVSITVRVTYRDMTLKKQIWEKTFSNYGIYDPNAGPTQQDVAITAAIEKLTEDILNEVVASW